MRPTRCRSRRRKARPCRGCCSPSKQPNRPRDSSCPGSARTAPGPASRGRRRRRGSCSRFATTSVPTRNGPSRSIGASVFSSTGGFRTDRSPPSGPGRGPTRRPPSTRSSPPRGRPATRFSRRRRAPPRMRRSGRTHRPTSYGSSISSPGTRPSPAPSSTSNGSAPARSFRGRRRMGARPAAGCPRRTTATSRAFCPAYHGSGSRRAWSSCPTKTTPAGTSFAPRLRCSSPERWA